MRRTRFPPCYRWDRSWSHDETNYGHPESSGNLVASKANCQERSKKGSCAHLVKIPIPREFSRETPQVSPAGGDRGRTADLPASLEEGRGWHCDDGEAAGHGRRYLREGRLREGSRLVREEDWKDSGPKPATGAEDYRAHRFAPIVAANRLSVTNAGSPSTCSEPYSYSQHSLPKTRASIGAEIEQKSYDRFTGTVKEPI